ncbi:hypothetical protein AAC387_Pa01g0846 [Persea americana]
MESMEKELLEFFEAAKKAADAAVENDAEENRCVDALKRLMGFPVTLQMLLSTQVGKRLRSLTKHPRENIRVTASDLLDLWKKVVMEETSKNHKKNSNSDGKQSMKAEVKSEDAGVVNGGTVKVDKFQNHDPMKVDKFSRSKSFNAEKVDRTETIKIQVSRSQSFKVEKVKLGETMKANVSRSETVDVERISMGEPIMVENIDGGETVKIEKIHQDEKQVTDINKPSRAPLKLTSMIKCNDSVRDKFRELLAEALSKVSGEADADIIDKVNACDPIWVAVSVESVMYEKLGRSNGAQKVKYRSIMFNLKDANNPDFRRKVLLGEIKPEELISMAPQEMASDKRKHENSKIKEKALFDCERGGPPKATTDQFKCSRCGQRKTTYYQLQTRSADEPMTTFVTCVNCNKHWKFC